MLQRRLLQALLLLLIPQSPMCILSGSRPAGFVVIFIFSFITTHFSYSFHSGKPAGAKEFQARRITSSPKIDGILDDEAWSRTPEPVHFTTFLPDNGNPSDVKTYVELLYDDHALYISARLYDPEPDKIRKEFGKRDDFNRNTDWFGFIVDPYNSGQNGFTFFVSAAGVQADYFLTGDNWDDNWDAVWESAVTIDEEGWKVEYKIPYYALRFPATDEQTWGINFYRQVKRKQEESYWNPVDNSVRGMVNQSGILKGLENIKPPLRISFLPYITAIYSNDGVNNKSQLDLAGGMDFKYGINEAYTLDMALIPDFSQVQSDNVVLNLSAFEVQFNENRQFFTEGTELFNKGNLLYSRRIGSTFGKITYDSETEEVISAPTAAPLLNATKISGRNSKGWGLGLLNAVTNKTFATIKHNETEEKRVEEVDPLTNFNVTVVDKLLKNNSSINLINTNVTRLAGGSDANVTGASIRLLDKTNTYRISAFGASSIIYNGESQLSVSDRGYKYNLALGKISGKIQYGLERNLESDSYNPNDLGYNRAPNEVAHEAYASYNIFKPFSIFNSYRFSLSSVYTRLYNPDKFRAFSLNAFTHARFKNFWGVGGSINTRPFNGYDFFEPREDGYFLLQPASYSYRIFAGSDSRKVVMANVSTGGWRRPEWKQEWSSLGTSVRYRVNDKLSLSLSVNREKGANARGYVTKLYNDENAEVLENIIFGERKVLTTNNVFGTKYTFNNKMGVNMRIRHYWSNVKYDRYFRLLANGELSDTEYTGTDETGESLHNTNFNAFNMDLVYFLQVAPGSFLNVVWKNAIYSDENDVNVGFAENFERTVKAPPINSFSIRFTYFLDFNTARNALSNKS